MPMVSKSAGCPATAPSKNGKKKKKKTNMSQKIDKKMKSYCQKMTKNNIF